jgi:hypothetical protein
MKRPLTLVDIILQRNPPPEDRYGVDHTPPLPDSKSARLVTYQAATAFLEEAFSRLDGYHVLTALSLLRSGAGQREHTQRDLVEAEVELAQAFFLKYGGGRESPSPQMVREISKNLKLHLLCFLEATSRPDLSDRSKILERRRLDTLTVRHTFYPNQAHRIYMEIADELSGIKVNNVRASIPSICKFGFSLPTYLTAIVESYIPQCESWMSGKNEPDWETWLHHFWIPTERFAEAMKIQAEEIETILEAWSLKPGDISGNKIEHIHLSNPVWGRPLISSKGKYFGFNPNVFLSFHSDIISNFLVPRVAKFSEKLGNARGIVLEKNLQSILKDIFPSAEFLFNSKWTHPQDQREYETDAIVLLDDIMLIFEAKGGSLSPQGRRGSQTLMDDLDKLIVESAVQSSRLGNLVAQKAGEIEFRLASSVKRVRCDRVERVSRFGVALERLVSMSNGYSPALIDRIRANGATPMPMLTIGDLEQLKNLLPTESSRLHYLLRRTEIDEEADFEADELDLIAMYLKTGFTTFLSAKHQGHSYGIYGISDFLRFYQEKEFYYDPSIALPVRTTTIWDRLISEVEQKKFKGWTAVVYDLLNTPLEGQERFEADILSAVKRIRKKPRRVIYWATMQVPFQKFPSLFLCAVTGIGDPAIQRLDIRDDFSQFCQQHPEERILLLTCDGLQRKSHPTIACYVNRGWKPGTWVSVEGAELFP